MNGGVTAVTAVIGGTDVTAVTGETGGETGGMTGETGGACMTGVTSDVFAVTAVTAVTGGSDVLAVTGEGGRNRNPRAAPAVTSVTDRRGSTWAGGRDKIAVKVKGIAGAERSQQN